MFLSDIVIILCRASEPGNVGAVCRAMKNMGLSRLRLVASEYWTPHGILSPTDPLYAAPLLARAIHAEDLWHNARFFDTLADATADCSLVVGTTRRRGRNRKTVTLTPRALTGWIAERFPSETMKADPAQNPAGKSIALVFGNERTGLNDDELRFCNIASHIPVSEAFPSINLSHAVQIYTYELFLAFGEVQENPVKGEWVALERTAVDTLAANIADILADIGFYKNIEEQTCFLRDLICRAGLTEREGQYLRNIFAKAARLGSFGIRGSYNKDKG